MRWLKKKIIKWTREVEGYGCDCAPRVAEDSGPRKDPEYQFRLYSAVNGQILEFNHYDRNTSRTHTSIYLVDKNEDLGDYVKKCLTLETLK